MRARRGIAAQHEGAGIDAAGLGHRRADARACIRAEAATDTRSRPTNVEVAKVITGARAVEIAAMAGARNGIRPPGTRGGR